MAATNQKTVSRAARVKADSEFSDDPRDMAKTRRHPVSHWVQSK